MSTFWLADERITKKNDGKVWHQCLAQPEITFLFGRRQSWQKRRQIHQIKQIRNFFEMFTAYFL